MQVHADAGKTRVVRAVTAFGHTAADLDGSLPPVSLAEPDSPGTYAGYDDFARRTADAPARRRCATSSAPGPRPRRRL